MHIDYILGAVVLFIAVIYFTSKNKKVAQPVSTPVVTTPPVYTPPVIPVPVLASVPSFLLELRSGFQTPSAALRAPVLSRNLDGSYSVTVENPTTVGQAPGYNEGTLTAGELDVLLRVDYTTPDTNLGSGYPNPTVTLKLPVISGTHAFTIRGAITNAISTDQPGNVYGLSTDAWTVTLTQ